VASLNPALSWVSKRLLQLDGKPDGELDFSSACFDFRRLSSTIFVFSGLTFWEIGDRLKELA